MAATTPASPPTDPEPATAAADTSRHPVRSSLRRIGTGIILAAAIGALVAAALLDPQRPPSLTLTAGTAAGSVEIVVSPSRAALTFPNMAPGDAAFASIVVRNDGSDRLRYAVTSATTEDLLARRLRLRIRSDVQSCSRGGFGRGWRLLYRGVLGDSDGRRVIGSPHRGPDQGDRVLGPGTEETLCAVVKLPRRTRNAFEGIEGTTATFSFVAEEAFPCRQRCSPGPRA